MTPIDKAWVAGRTAPLDGAVRLVTLLQEAGGLQCNCRPETDGMTGDPGRTEPKSRRPCPRENGDASIGSTAQPTAVQGALLGSRARGGCGRET